MGRNKGGGKGNKEGLGAARGAEVMQGEKGNRRWGGGDVDGRHGKELSEEKGIGPSRGAVLLPSPRAPSPGCSPHVPQQQQQQQQPCFRATIASWLSEQGRGAGRPCDLCSSIRGAGTSTRPAAGTPGAGGSSIGSNASTGGGQAAGCLQPTAAGAAPWALGASGAPASAFCSFSTAAGVRVAGSGTDGEIR